MSFAVMDEEVVIVGAGIGGLATAVALKRVGIRAIILESASELRATGAGISLLSNAWRALDALGVADKLMALYNPVENGFVTDIKTKATQQNMRFDSSKRGVAMTVHRKTLLQFLADELPQDTIYFSSKVTSIESQVEDGSWISAIGLQNGTIIKAKVVIGCDGVHSVIANKLKLRPPVYSGRYAVRGLAVYPEGHGLGHDVQQFVDASRRGGFVPLNDKDVYWFLLWQTPHERKDVETHDPKSITRDIVDKLASDFPPSYLDVVQHSDISTVSWAPLMFRYPWDIFFGNLNTENMTVVGDAMHPTTPDLGQGGCMTLEDAVILGRHFGNSISSDGMLRPEAVRQALKKYTDERKWRTAGIVGMSFISGWIQQDGSGWWRIFLRTVFYKSALPRVVQKVQHFDCGRLPNNIGTY